MIGHAPFFDAAIGRFQEAKIIDLGESGQRGDQTDVRPFRRFHRANAAIVGGMNVAHLEPGAIPRQTARPQRRQAAFVRQFGQRIDLVHELRKLAATEEIADDRREGLGIDQLLGRHALQALIKQGHAFLDQPFGAGQADAALVGQQFPDRADAPASQVVNVIQRAFALFQAQQILGRRHQVFLGQDARVAALDAQLLVDLVTADPAQIIPFGVEEEPLDERAGVGGGGRVAGAQAAVNVLERFLFVLGRVLFEAFDDDAVIHRRVHHADFGHAQFGDLLDHRLGKRLERARHHQALVLVLRVFHQDLVLDVLQFFGLLDAQFLDFIKQLEDVRVGAVAEGAEEGGGEEFAAPLFPVQIDVKHVAGVELRLVPGAAVGDDAEGMEGLAVGMLAGFKGQTGRAVQLADDDPFGAIDDEGALRGHQGQLAHEHFFLFRPLFLLEQKGDMQRRAVGDALAQAFQPVVFWLADFVAVKIQDAFAIVTFDGKNLGEDRLQSDVLALGRRRVGLEEFPVGIGLQLDQIGRGNDLLDLSKMDAFC